MVHIPSYEVEKVESGRSAERLEQTVAHITPLSSPPPQLRSYTEAAIHQNIKKLYKEARIHQHMGKVMQMRQKYGAPDKLRTRMTVWEAIASLDNFVDVSDPDIELPNIVHLYQTAEGLRKKNYPDWLILTGFIHDLGKCIFLKGCPEDGTTLDTQWGIVGDTWVCGAEIPSCMVYPEFNKLNLDSHRPECAGEVGAYEEGCGLDQCLVSYGHDEYLYQVLSNNENVKLPPEALYVIRYHSLYPWHTGGAYSALESSYDRMMKGWVLMFQQHDLYTKSNTPYTEKELQEMRKYYSGLIDKYLPGKLRW